MRVLLVNKFLFPKGGAETYVLKLGMQLSQMGHEVAYFGMYDSRNTVGNDAGAYTSHKEFRSKLSIEKFLYPFDIIYSVHARRQIRKVLDQFQPDVVHLNNINFQITPSIIYEIKARGIPIVWTAHDYQIVCPNHLLYIMQDNRICTQCLSGHCGACVRNRCLHGSTMKSIVAMAEGQLYRWLSAYRMVDRIVCPSRFLMEKLETREDIRGKCSVLYNFVDEVPYRSVEQGDYVLYFGRYDAEKGIRTLVEVCKRLPHIQFLFAGSGELTQELEGVPNIQNVGFQTGEALELLIRRAVMTVYPSEWYENCPFSVIESQMYGVPVVGANIGGIPELIEDGKTGLLFESGDRDDLAAKILTLWEDRALAQQMAEHCLAISRDDARRYSEKMVEIYQSILPAT